MEAHYFPISLNKGSPFLSHTSMTLATFWKDSVSFPLVSMKLQGKEPHWCQQCHTSIPGPNVGGWEDAEFSLTGLGSCHGLVPRARGGVNDCE